MEKDVSGIVVDGMMLPITKEEARARIAQLERHIATPPETLLEYYLQVMQEQYPATLKAWEKNDDTPTVERFL